MTEFQRVVVTAPPGPQMVLADRSPAEECDPYQESDTIFKQRENPAVHGGSESRKFR